MLPKELLRLNVTNVMEGLKTIEDNPKVMAIVTKDYFHSTLVYQFKSDHGCITTCKGVTRTEAQGLKQI